MCVSSKTVFIKRKPALLPVRIDVLLFRMGCYASMSVPGWGRHGRVGAEEGFAESVSLKWSQMELRTEEGEDCFRG